MSRIDMFSGSKEYTFNSKDKSLGNLFNINIHEPPFKNIAAEPNASFWEKPSFNTWNNKPLGLSFTIELDSNQGSMTPLETKQISKILLTAGIAANAITSLGTNYLSSKLFNSDSDSGRLFGSLFSQGATTALNSIGNNLLNGSTWSDNVLKDTGASLAGTAVGIGANYLGQGINNLGGDTWGSRFLGLATSTGLGTVGGLAASNLVKYGSTAGKVTGYVQAADGSTKAVRLGLFGKGLGQVNPYGLALSVVGEGLAAANGTPREYEGRYGKNVQIANTAYEGVQTAIGMIPGYGLLISGFMALNKGLHGVGGGTSGMTKNDAYLFGTYWAPAGASIINNLTGHTTGNLENYNLFTHLKMFDFMGNAYGDLGDRIKQAAEELNKKYGGGLGFGGLFSSEDEYKKALANIDLINLVTPLLLDLYQKSYLSRIKAFDMSSINNQRYALNINGRFKSLPIGKRGMKILSNAVNHNMGMRLLSAAAFIDDKQAILCSAVD